ncbi:MAG: hypothetical protein A7315_08240 [Candidatus Altiarchaeales archaeon WOR_SM1_79]|nr:MAG: hypothetical protein A7315_08240 [Candidatus Altiarchaeales archaeon WOR_SM1_79]
MNAPKLQYIICFLIVLAVVGILLLFGNPNYKAPPAPPATIKNEFIKLETYERVSDNNIYFYAKNKKILYFDPWGAFVTYNSTNKRIFGSYKRKDEAWFNNLDSKKVEVNGDTMKVSWYNPEKDPGEICYIFELQKDKPSVKVTLFANVSEPGKLSGAAYRAIGSGDRIYIPDYGIFDNNHFSVHNLGKEDTAFLLNSEDNESIKIHGNLTGMIVSFFWGGIFLHTDLTGTPKNSQFSPIYIEIQPIPGETKKLISQEERYSIQNNNLELKTKGKADSNIYLYEDNKKLLNFNAEEFLLNYDGEAKRFFNAYSPEPSWFNERDSKKVEINGNVMKVSWHNNTKDPGEGGYVFELQGNRVKITFFVNVSDRTKLGRSSYGIVHSWGTTDYEYDLIYLPERILKNDHFTNHISEYPEKENYELLVDTENHKKIKIVFEDKNGTVENLFYGKVPRFYVSPDKLTNYPPIYIDTDVDDINIFTSEREEMINGNNNRDNIYSLNTDNNLVEFYLTYDDTGTLIDDSHPRVIAISTDHPYTAAAGEVVHFNCIAKNEGSTPALYPVIEINAWTKDKRMEQVERFCKLKDTFNSGGGMENPGGVTSCSTAWDIPEGIVNYTFGCYIEGTGNGMAYGSENNPDNGRKINIAEDGGERGIITEFNDGYRNKNFTLHLSFGEVIHI